MRAYSTSAAAFRGRVATATVSIIRGQGTSVSSMSVVATFLVRPDTNAEVKRGYTAGIAGSSPSYTSHLSAA
jgi:hypothetical protein